jgi:hypothetical protein
MSGKIVTRLAGVGVAFLILPSRPLSVATGQHRSAPLRPEVGQPAPPFTAETIDGKKIALADYRGKSAVLLVFCSEH